MRKTSFKTLLLLLFAAFLSCGCGGRASREGVARSETTAQTAAKPQKGQPVTYTYKIKAIYPHDTRSYTQGLYWHEGYLWEGTGQFRESALKKVELETGRVVESIRLEDRHFGEGIALLDDRIYQLTWMDGLAFVYDSSTLRRIETLSYEGEGWGLTTDGNRLYMSDGSHQIHLLDPQTFRREKSIDVKMGRRSIHQINELEWIKGKIWANVYMTESIVIIDPASGEVEGVIDLTGILPAADRNPDTDVLNGIAYDAANDRIFVTGKYWNKLFEIDIVPK